MAIVFGESGAWHGIVLDLRNLGLIVHSPSEIVPLLTKLRDNLKPSIEKKRSEVAQGLEIVNSRIASLRAESGFWPAITNWFRIRGCNTAIARLKREEHEYEAFLTRQIHRLEKLLHSPELAGVRAEVSVIAHLDRLSADYTVFNNLRLTAKRYIHFNGAALQSAQIDHLVLSRTGVFVIETKRWSRHFVESGKYFNPYDQINRSAYLCYDRLRSEFGKIRVRSVIACDGELPAARENLYVKILPIEQLVGYITWFRREELTSDQVMQMRQFLKWFMDNPGP